MDTTVAAAIVPHVKVLVTEALTATVVPRWRLLLQDAAALHPGHLVVDLTDCTFVDAAGIELLVDVHRRVWADGGRLTLHGLSARLHRLLEISRVDRVLQTASAPPGYQPKHRTTRHTPTGPLQDKTVAAPAGEVRWWEPVPSG